MELSLYNTLAREKEIFTPADKNLIKIYVCGPTVYDYPHIGNARSVVVYDVLYRLLISLYGKNNVLYVRNITDVDDKIIDRARLLQIKIGDLTATTTQYFHDDMDYLNCLRPTIEPKATAHINEMIDIIESLIAKGCAYIADGHVYFDVLSAKEYTRLSGRSLDEMLQGVRIETDENKRHTSDFILWKPKSDNEELEANFTSPWGTGRPGWHIECSAMSHKYLGENFDIHGGGADLIFPHHTNEIAQSTCAFPGSKFAKTWVHNGFLTVDSEKMSKSLGNFVTVNDLRNKTIQGDPLRLFLLSAQYRKPLDFNDKALADSHKTIDYWYRALEGIEVGHTPNSFPEDFLSALLDDLNTPLAIKIINDYARLAHSSTDINDKKNYATLVLACANLIGLMHASSQEWFKGNHNESEIDALVAARALAKNEKNWAKADNLRQTLEDIGIILEDKSDGTTSWRKKL